jgi:hypothetical protein
MIRLNEEQRKLWADKLMDLANLSVAALVFGQFLSPIGLNWLLFGLGLFIYIVLCIISTNLMR